MGNEEKKKKRKKSTPDKAQKVRTGFTDARRLAAGAVKARCWNHQRSALNGNDQRT
jgi:hypothetical protein